MKYLIACVAAAGLIATPALAQSTDATQDTGASATTTTTTKHTTHKMHHAAKKGHHHAMRCSCPAHHMKTHHVAKTTTTKSLFPSAPPRYRSFLEPGEPSFPPIAVATDGPFVVVFGPNMGLP